MFLEPEYRRSVCASVTTYSFEYAEAVLQTGTQKGNLSLRSIFQFMIDPHETRCVRHRPSRRSETIVLRVNSGTRLGKSCFALSWRYNSGPMDSGLQNRVAIVAASSQGIGRATAEAFAAEGCHIAMCARNPAALQAAADNIRRLHRVEVFTRAFDVTDPSEVKHFVSAVVEKFGSVDICVTNAGGPPAKGFLAASTEEWKRALDANFLSTVYFAREVIPFMQKRKWGRIVTITSITTKQPVPDLDLSNAVRAAVVGLVKSLANEFGKDGILVNNVGPGFTAT